MAKAKDAFRTISEVAEWLDTPTHVLRFWESKFSQIKPVKGAGGRRYYRPTDMELLGGIKQLLHEDGLTIKGTQKLLREKGVRYVATLGQTLEDKPAPTEASKATPPEPDTTQTAAPAPQEPAPQAVVAASNPVQDMLPFDPPAAAPPTLELPPPPPDGDADVPGRLLAALPADDSRIRNHAAEIAPLLERLAALRAKLAG
ncbi:MerR family transcriptional regulator [Yoonia litorea]|uniref:MerR HTH family regulatory protein n=1 Tax=Yoonia litorea TaxID=1123755 RepID=A0A1I6LZE0_9RHOB|nr:MerR family transcriptional regulator [Yoonia litorea]SFS08803.1 MerR HTH family regulatory protein [Yoonia litorea]